ncbi:arabinose-5-phosphate isomerase [Paramicrobacterium humi]|uniref:Arabinose-5-phosphate isomerase n=1 Tax=Paramicrobacterium humi TaxID=640635 RepID=A0A1H4KV37_9MICO|nr:SIS domain-containing protein [Microbacterium humi]SEB61985.1 arabinose-5-phosphate isomerase [Microbacterium humi]
MANNEDGIVRLAREFIDREARALANLASLIDESFVDIVERVLATPGKVITTGAGTSGIMAARLAHILAVSGTPALYLSSQDALHGGMAAITREDLVIAFSKGGQSAELTELTVRLGERGVHVIAVTEKPESPFALAAGTVVRVATDPVDADPGGLIAMGSTLVAGAWGDALATTLMAANQYDWKEVLHSHPAGIVGQQTKLPETLSLGLSLPDEKESR